MDQGHALGLTLSDLFVDGGSRNGSEPLNVYAYTDEQGEPLSEVGRFPGKKFLQRRPGGSDWKGGIQGVRRVLYHLPQVLKGIEADKRIFLVEGEKDVHAIEARGEVATTNPGGAGKWRPEFTKMLRDADVVVVADQDDPGRRHAAAVAAALDGVARSVRVVKPIEGKDVSDHLSAGHTLDALAPVEESGAKPSTEAKRPTTRASDLHKQRLRWLWRGRLALGYLAVWCGAGDIGKSLFAVWTITQLGHGTLPGRFLGEPASALIICTEDGRLDMWLPRLEAAGADLDRVEFLDYPPDWNLRDGVDFIDRALIGTDIRIVFVDALMSHMPEAHGSENTRSPTFVRQALTPLAALCNERKVTGLFGLHPRKAGGETFADVVQESGVFTQLPRLGLLFGIHPDDLELPKSQQRRVLLRGKGNPGRDPGALSFRISERLLDWDDDEPVDPVEDAIAYITDVEPCEITERQLLGAKVNDRPMSKVDQAEALIRVALRDGEWHETKPIREELARLDLDHDANVGAAKRRVRVKSTKQAGVTDGPWGWQIVRSSNSTPNPDSSNAARATLDRFLIVPPENTLFPNEHGKDQRISSSERNDDPDSEESRISRTPRAHAPARDAPAHVECPNPDGHRAKHHRPHPSGGGTVCVLCHPPAQTSTERTIR